MSTSSLRRQVKNIVHNYSEAEIKVREATSNDPWGPSSSLMSEIADLTYNVVAFSEIMSMVWKRLNDHGKNWRHVYKAMTLMEYLIKTGSERVAQQCRENIYAVQTLKDFQYIDRDGKDQGVNVREKAKQLVTLLKDEERLKEERVHALKTKEKMASSAPTLSGVSASAPLAGGVSGGGGVAGGVPGDPEQAWPQSSGEEDLQLQLALAMSKEEAEQLSAPPPRTDDELQLRVALSLSREEHDKEERLRRGDDLRLQMALEESKREKAKPEESSLMDLANVFPASATSVSPADPWGGGATQSQASTDPWGSGGVAISAADPWGSGGQPVPASHAPATSTDPWGESGGAVSKGDPWSSTAVTPPPPSLDPWGTPASPPQRDPWSSETPPSSDPWGGREGLQHSNGTADSDLGEAPPPLSLSPDSFDFSSIGSSLPPSVPARKTPESFLGPNASLVDLDSLVSQKPKTSVTSAPSAVSAPASNPFLNTGVSTSTTPLPSSRGVSPNPFSSSPPPPSSSSLNLSQLSQFNQQQQQQLRTSPLPPPLSMGMVQPGAPPLSMGMVQPGVPPLSMGMVQPGFPYPTVSPLGGPGGPILIGAPHMMMGMPVGLPPPSMTSLPSNNQTSTGGGASSTNPFLL
ncbi:epsin-1 isoform X1 [Acipenser ruthenus]|uniref:epsin-1-like isoform X1 n=1 Tax=Acipenser ruthenus TaxID=7906 RepID=UPI002741FEB2|nr:epsin-1-like isoform X1 [Acipenser ruthenus]XP_058874447.1 epsin-1 isoform X1 [Acipenser ruthenus]